MTPDDLDTKSLEELDRIFAVEIACLDITTPRRWLSGDCRTTVTAPAYIPPFSSSANTVLPWLEKAGHPSWTRAAEYSRGVRWDGWMIEVGPSHAIAPTFPHAAVKALIRAERAKKG